MIIYFIENNLISESESGFKSDGSSVNQLLAITHGIFDENYKLRGVFLDISKVFDYVKHVRTIDNLKRNGIAGNLLSLF